MSISIAQQKSGTTGSASSLAVTFNNPTVNGNGIVVSVGSTHAITSVTDDVSNTYTQRRTANFFSSTFSYIFDCVNISNNPTTITAHTSSGTVITITIYEVNGTLTAHAGNSNSANTTAIAAGAFTTTTADTIAFASMNCSAASPTQPSGYTEDSTGVAQGQAHRVYTTTQSSINPAWSNNTGGASACIEAYTSTNTGSVVYNKSLTSTLTLTETQTYVGVFPRSVSESLTFTETQTYIDSFAPHVTSTLTLSETQTTQNALVRAVSETVTFSETQTTKNVLKRFVNQSLTLVSTPLPIGITDHTVSQTVTFTETQTTQNVLNPTLSQGLGIANLPSVTTVLNLPVSETLTLVGTASRAAGLYNESASSTLALSETQTYTATRVGSVSEMLTFTETQTTQNVLNKSVSETLTFVSTPTKTSSHMLEVDQTITFTPHIAKAQELSVTSTLTFVQVTPIPVKQTFWFIDNSIVQKTPIASSGSNGGTLVLTFPATTSLNNGIVVVVGSQSSGGTTITSITDDATGNTYSLLQDANNLNTPRSRIYYVSAAHALNSITLHMSTTGNQVAAMAYEISGTIQPDTGNNHWENNSTQTTGSITTASSTLVFGVDTVGGPVTSPAGWNFDGQAQGVNFISNIYSSTQTGLNPAFADTVSQRYAAAIESFTTANRGGIHQSIGLTSTATETHVSNPAMFQTLNLSQPNRIPLNYTLQRTISQSLSFEQDQVGVASKPVSNTLTFSETQTVELIKTVRHTLDIGQFASPQVAYNVTVISLLQPFQTIAPGPNHLSEHVSSVLTLTGTASGYDTKPVSETLHLTQTVVGVGSKAVVQHMSLTQTIKLNKSLGVSASNRLIPAQAIHTNVSRAVSAHSFFGFNGFQKATKAYHVSASNVLTLTSLGTRERHSESISQSLTLVETIARSRLTALTVAEVLHLTQNPVLSLSKALAVTDTLTFLPTHGRFLGDLTFQVPNIQYIITEPCTLLRGPGQVVVLPSPQLGDGEGNTGQFTVRFAINGQSYSYVKNNNTSKLNYTFYLSRSKCRELQKFLQTYQAQLVDMQNWKGELWKVYITNNPFETTSVSMYTNGRPTNEERWDISLEFEGIRMN